MGEGQGRLFELSFNRAIKLRQSDPGISDNAGALLLREVDQRLGLTSDLAAQLIDDRDPRYVRYSQKELLRQHLYGLSLGYVHQDDQDALAHDVALKLSVSDRPGCQVAHEGLASQPSDWRLIERLSSKPNRHALRETLAWSIARHQQASGNGRAVLQGTIDIDPFPIAVHGQQPGGAYHGYYGKTIYHPIVASFSAAGSYEHPRLGDGFVHALLRRGNCSSAEGALRFTREALRKCRPLARALDVRIDAGLVEGKLLDGIDDEKAYFLGRIRNNAVLDELARPHLRRDPGRPSKDGNEFAIDLGQYQAQTWTRPYRLVLVVVDLPDPKTGLRALFPHHFFLVTNYSPQQRQAWDLLEHYRQRGTFEYRLGEVQRLRRGQPFPGRFSSQRDDPAAQAAGRQPGRHAPRRDGKRHWQRLGPPAPAADGAAGRGPGGRAWPPPAGGRGSGPRGALGKAAAPDQPLVARSQLGPQPAAAAPVDRPAVACPSGSGPPRVTPPSLVPG